MHIGKFYKKGKFHIIRGKGMTYYEAKCSRMINKENVIEVSKEELIKLNKEYKICEQCYKHYLGL